MLDVTGILPVENLNLDFVTGQMTDLKNLDT